MHASLGRFRALIYTDRHICIKKERRMSSLTGPLLFAAVELSTHVQALHLPFWWVMLPSALVLSGIFHYRGFRNSNDDDEENLLFCPASSSFFFFTHAAYQTLDLILVVALLHHGILLHQDPYQLTPVFTLAPILVCSMLDLEHGLYTIYQLVLVASFFICFLLLVFNPSSSSTDFTPPPHLAVSVLAVIVLWPAVLFSSSKRNDFFVYPVLCALVVCYYHQHDSTGAYQWQLRACIALTVVLARVNSFTLHTNWWWPFYSSSTRLTLAFFGIAIGTYLQREAYAVGRVVVLCIMVLLLLSLRFSSLLLKPKKGEEAAASSALKEQEGRTARHWLVIPHDEYTKRASGTAASLLTKSF